MAELRLPACSLLQALYLYGFSCYERGDLCLVTGASGYLATWIIEKLLATGFSVRGTVRKINDPKNDFLKNRFPELELREANLDSAANWPECLEGVKWVFHTASPAAISSKKEDKVDLGIQGVENIFNAALSADSVQKIVMTSSEGAICFGHPASKSEFSENDWSIPDNIGSYYKSKTLSENRAWQIIRNKENNPRQIPLTVINPAIILGPSISPNTGTSLKLIHSIIEGKVPMYPDINSFLVDVRDCARMHIELMDNPETDGHRHLCYSIRTRMIEIANSVHRLEYNKKDKPPKLMPKYMMWLGRHFNEDAKTVYTISRREIDYHTLHPGLFNYEFRDLDEMVAATVKSMKQ